jgi:hypothetical protein
MNAFLQFRTNRAFSDGMKAYRTGHPPHAPMHYCEHSGDWVRGWHVAWLAKNFRQDKLPLGRAGSQVGT